MDRYSPNQFSRLENRISYLSREVEAFRSILMSTKKDLDNVISEVNALREDLYRDQQHEEV